MCCGIDIVQQNITSFKLNDGMFYRNLLVPHYTIMDMKNVTQFRLQDMVKIMKEFLVLKKFQDQSI